MKMMMNMMTGSTNESHVTVMMMMMMMMMIMVKMIVKMIVMMIVMVIVMIIVMITMMIDIDSSRSITRERHHTKQNDMSCFLSFLHTGISCQVLCSTCDVR